MKLIRIEERDLKHWGKPCEVNELHIKQPNEVELEKAIAMTSVNDIDTIIIYL